MVCRYKELFFFRQTTNGISDYCAVAIHGTKQAWITKNQLETGKCFVFFSVRISMLNFDKTMSSFRFRASGGRCVVGFVGAISP